MLIIDQLEIYASLLCLLLTWKATKCVLNVA